MTDKSRKWLKVRIFFIFFVFVALMITISAKAYHLHVVKSEWLSQLANRQRERNIPLAPKRGVIYDRKGEELAISIDVDSIYAEPPKVTDAALYAKKLASILKVNRKELRKKLALDKRFTWVKRRITPDQSMKVKRLKLKGISSVREAKRFHPNREVAGNIVGFVGLDSKGLEGLELEYDGYLKGKAAFLIAERDALGRMICSDGLGQKDDLIGNDLILTIDKTLQYVAERELRKAVTKARAKSGTLIVMVPKTGELLAIAVYPQFNPNIFWKHSPSDWRNRAITDSFEPGSTFKMFLLAAALEEGIVSRNDIFFCENGSYIVGKHRIRDVHPQGWLSVKNIMKVSSNIGASKIGEKLGKKKFYEYIRKFGFGERTGIDLPGETPGLLRSPDKWSQVALDTISFGQGISVSAIQLVAGLSAIANKGYLMKPYVVKQIVSPNGKIVKEFLPQIVRRVISEEVAKQVTSILKSTVLEGGTGTMAFTQGYDVAGKTGTAQKADPLSGGYYKGKYVASFIGFLPAEDPEVAILVVIDEPKGKYYGGQVAAPVFKTVGEKTLQYLNVLPTRMVDQRKSAPHRALAQNKGPRNPKVRQGGKNKSSEQFVVPDFDGMSMRQVLRLMRDSQVDVRIMGSGRVVEQSLKPGSVVNAGGKFRIKFQQPS